MSEHLPSAKIMRRAIKEARLAESSGNYRLGAVVVTKDLEVLSSAHTELHTRPDPTAHAEIIALRGAAELRESKYLADCFLYTTLEPCPMCTSAAIWAKLGGIVFGATLEDVLEFGSHSDPRFTWRQITVKAQTIIDAGTPRLSLSGGFLRDECLVLFGDSDDS
jgi:tRNA(Arg) A34 adenosine deaminase TadA